VILKRQLTFPSEDALMNDKNGKLQEGFLRLGDFYNMKYA